MGMMELDEHPHRVLAEAQPSTSSAAPQSAEEPEAAACENDISSSEETNICSPSASESGSEFNQESPSSDSSDDPDEAHRVTTSSQLKMWHTLFNLSPLPHPRSPLGCLMVFGFLCLV